MMRHKAANSSSITTLSGNGFKGPESSIGRGHWPQTMDTIKGAIRFTVNWSCLCVCEQIPLPILLLNGFGQVSCLPFDLKHWSPHWFYRQQVNVRLISRHYRLYQQSGKEVPFVWFKSNRWANSCQIHWDPLLKWVMSNFTGEPDLITMYIASPVVIMSSSHTIEMGYHWFIENETLTIVWQYLNTFGHLTSISWKQKINFNLGKWIHLVHVATQ